MKRFFILYKKIAEIVAMPLLLAYFFRADVGREYGVGFLKKFALLRVFRRNVKKIPSASDWQEHAVMAARILQIPRVWQGDVIECGSYKGASTANLSLACALAGRKLIVCDSFEGLPRPIDDDRFHVQEIKGKHKEYKKGDYSGALEEVRANITRYGNIAVCEFIKGYFEQTFPSLHSRTFVFIFLDVDLNESLKTCLRFLWPLLKEKCLLFSHEAQDMAFISLFFDDGWWQHELGMRAPSFIGAGTGLPLGIGKGSSIGYTEKI